MTARVPSVSTTESSVPNSTDAVPSSTIRLLDLADLDPGDPDEVAVLEPRHVGELCLVHRFCPEAQLSKDRHHGKGQDQRHGDVQRDPDRVPRRFPLTGAAHARPEVRAPSG